MSRKSALSVLSATLAALCFTSTARANPSASLTVTQTQTDGSPIPAGGVLNGTAVLVNVQYQLTDLPSDGAFIEFDICAPGQSIAGYPSGGEIEWGNQPACTLANGSGGVRVRSPHIGSSGSATQAVTGVYTIALATSGIIDGANTQWTVPVRVVIDSTARPTLYSSSFVILGTSAYSPLFSTSIFGVVAAPAPIGGAPGYNVSFHLQPTQWPWVTGIAPMPHTTVTGTIPAGAQYVGYNIAPLSDITNYGPAFVAATFNDNRAFTLGSDGTTYSFSLDHLITFANNDTAVDLTLWFPKTAHTVAHTPVTAAFSNGATFNDDPTIVLGDAFTYGNKMHREWNGWWTTLAANSPNYGDNPTEYVSAGGLIEWWVYFGFTNENWGAAAGVNPALIDQIPPGEAVYDVYSVRDDNGSRDVSDLVDFSISTEPGCGPGPGTTWTPAGLHDSATLATARCLRVMYPGVYQTSVSMQYSARQTAAAEAQVLSSPAGYVFDDNYAYALLDNGAGVHAGNSTSVWAGDPTIAQITGRVTVQNAAQPMTWTYPAEWTFPYAKVGDDVYAGAGVPFHQDANAPAGFTDLTFSETLPLELDLRGPPTLAPGYAYPIGDDGQPMIPSCTWNAQDRSQLPIVPASFTCTFAGHYPAYREEPFTTPGCNATNEYCLNNWQTKDASGNYVLNEFVFQVPQHIISGYQGQQIVQRFSAWSTQPLDQNGNPRAGSSAATAYLSGPNENLLAINGVLQVGLTDVAQASVITAHSTVPFNLSYANSGSAAIANTRIYDLLGRDSTTGAPLAGCETPRFVSAVNQGGDPAPLIEYTTDAAPQPNDSSNWSATPPSDLSLVTGVRITPVSAFSSTPGVYGPNDPAGHVQLTVADTQGAGGRICNSAAIVGQGFAIAGSTANPVDVISGCTEQVIHAPAQSDYGMLLFEDLWPSNGDDDFNDETLAYNETFLVDDAGTQAMQVNLNVLSVGASIHSGVYLRLPVDANAAALIVRYNEDGTSTTLTPVQGEGNLVVELVHDTRSLFTAQDAFINTQPNVTAQTGKGLSVRILFSSPQSLDTGAAPFDLFIAQSGDYGHQLHQAQYAGTDRVNQSLYGQSDDRSTGGAHYINENGLAFALHIPTLVAWPQERVQLDTLYPRVDTFASSGGATDSDWYMHLEAAQAFTKGNGILAPAPSLVGPGLSACQGSNE